MAEDTPETTATSPEPAAPETTDDDTTVRLPDGKEYPVKDVLAWKDAGLRQKDYTQKTMALSEERKEIDALRAQLEERLSSLTPANHQNGTDDEYAALDETVPGLGKFAAEVRSTLRELKQAQDKIDRESQEYVEAQEREDKMEAALDQWSKQPFAVRKDLQSYMEQNGLPPDKAEIAYRALYGYRLGETAKEVAMRKRGADAPPPMKGGGIGITQSAAGDVPGVQRPIAETSWQEIRNRAIADPRRPRV
jgi:hypothetical protein